MHTLALVLYAVSSSAYAVQVATPAFSPAAGTYDSAQSVTISSTTTSATVCYTTDGSMPTETNGTRCTGPVRIGSTTILKSVAYKTGFAGSPVTSGIYTITNSPAPILNVIYNVTTSNGKGFYPLAALTQGSDGNFYGSTEYGGNGHKGTIFKVTLTGTLTTLVSFNGTNGAFPMAALVQGNDGNFYGTTSQGGDNHAGTIFKVTPAGVLTTLASFDTTVPPNSNWSPLAGAALVQDSDGSFYGTTPVGGSKYGALFKMTPAGVLTALASFTTILPSRFHLNDVAFDTNNSNYISTATLPLVLGSDGNFYGTTWNSGSSKRGTIFKATPAGVLTTLVTFNIENGANPSGSLVQGNDGNFYGTTYGGGSNDDGTVFKMTPAGALTTLVSFDRTNGMEPSGGLVKGHDGNFYGTTNLGGTNKYGTIFKITPAGAVTTLVSFDLANGARPEELVQGSDGNFYGICLGFDSIDSWVIFQLIVPPATNQSKSTTALPSPKI